MKYIIVFLFFLPSVIVRAQVSGNAQNLCGITSDNSLEDCKRVQQRLFNMQKSGLLNFRQDEVEVVKQTQLLQPNAPTGIRFLWPLTSRKAEKYSYLSTKNFVDMDTRDCYMRDYNGGFRTYDGHNGMDIGIGPYSWERMNANDVHVIAAASGIIVEKRDGGFDHNCTWDNPPWVGVSPAGNYVAILHADGQTVTYYKHLKLGSLLAKDSGDRVEAGEYLGVVGSSGRSTAPHLHFEVHVGWGDPDKPDGTLIEPFAGPYNTATNVSLWVNQPSYQEPTITGIETFNISSPDWYTASCDSSIDRSSLTNNFSPGQSVHFRVFQRDWTDLSSISFSLTRPDGSAETTWTPVFNSGQQMYNCDSSLGYQDFRFSKLGLDKTFPLNSLTGTWALSFAFNGKPYNHYFAVGCIANQNFTGVHAGNRGFLASNTITSIVFIGGVSTNNIEYRADNQVVLSPGFVATAGCEFVANTKGCNSGN